MLPALRSARQGWVDVVGSHVGGVHVSVRRVHEREVQMLGIALCDRHDVLTDRHELSRALLVTLPAHRTHREHDLIARPTSSAGPPSTCLT